ncbi:excisionase [Candidatus Peregrinibacteria bacterium CG22_combo_CG10-13_8_21_14_all_44_10]|nr:MAG: excisionase [Candidatus Peregrinibacteria bacterium CG22_combo_CG10-13_8_21_14_all_44_10]PIS03753.1 MAG: excisionase [Candidatus Peregrinibacteria bacterium CG10_big_fil_rev_8_21_14_0_10_44_7]PIX79488.1 MAG: excisionase [Candidatus Peregrinibacteria bacterium CG_4_10_14_3_um_filter_44_21]PJB89641.1 MAG: excisionase [Candidatus Peregrinibacteria bacterium CG_4_9_14_0_8_um_filter_44_15]
MGNRLLTAEQVAKELQVHHLTVLKFIKQKKLKAIRLGRVYRIRETDLENFLNKYYL